MEIWKRNMIVLCIGNFMFFVGISMIVPFLPIYVQELGVSDVRHAALWASSIFAVNHLFLSIFPRCGAGFPTNTERKKC